MHHPLMPSYVKHIGVPNYMFGFFFAFMNLGTMIGGPFWGNLGDAGKKKMVVILGFIIYGVNQALFGMGHIFDQWILSIFRLVSGFGIAAAITVISGEIIVVSDQGKRARNIAYGAAALALGGSFGQFFGGFIHTNSFFIQLFRTDLFFNALLFQCLLNIALAIFVFFFFKPEPVKNSSNKKRAQFWEGFKEIKNIGPELLFFLLSLTFITVAATNVDKYLDIYFVELGYEADQLGNFKMIVGLVSLFAAILLVPLFMKIKKKLSLIAIFQILSSILIFIVFRSKETQFIIYIYSIFMIYIGIKAIYAPLEQEHVASFSNENNIATTMGIRQSFYSIGTIVGPIFGAFVYDYNPLTLFDTSIIFFLLSVVLLLVSGLFRKKSYISNQFKTTESYK